MENREIRYDKVPEIPFRVANTLYNDLEQLTLPTFSIGRYKAIYNEKMKCKGMTLKEARILTICELINENNSRLLTYLQDRLGAALL